MKKNLFSMLVLCLIGLQSVLAQSREVSGIVTSADDGLSIPGVSVIIKGTTIGTTTDFDGKYTIATEEGQILIYSFVGMKKVELPANTDVINLVMESESIGMDEVVVIGYGTASRKSFAGSAASVDSESIESKQVSSISSALAGEIAGVTVTKSGSPGANATIVIRGQGSINAASAPLYVVDGIPFTGNINSIAPGDVASTTVLKDASATAIYGSRGANGVVLIETKQGKDGKNTITASVSFGINKRMVPMYDRMASPEQFMEMSWLGQRNKYLTANGANSDNWDSLISDANTYASQNLFGDGNINENYNMWDVANSDLIGSDGKFNPNAKRRYSPKSWEDETFSVGRRTSADVSFRGASKGIKYFSSLSYLDDEGYYINSGFKRFTLRSNIQYNPTKWLKGTTSLSYTHSDRDYPGQDRGGNNGFMFAQSIPGIYGPYLRDADGNIIYDDLLKEDKYDFGFAHSRPFSGGMNPVGAINKDIKNKTSHNVNLVQKLTATLTDDLTLESTFGYNVRAYQYSSLSNPYYGNGAGSGSVSRSDRITASYTWNQLLRYTKSFNDHNISAFIAHEANHYENRNVGAWNKQIVDPEVPELSNGVAMGGKGYSSSDSYAIESYFGRASYNYNDKYFLTGTFRRDGTSRFPYDKWGNFGSIAAAWVISSEEFMPDSQLKYLKYKISFGSNGNQSYGDNYYPARTKYELSNLNGDVALNGTVANNNLSWESIYTFNTGIEASYSNFLDFGLDFYMKTTKDLLMDMRIAPSTGVALIDVSDGQMQNYGVDFNATIKAINTDDFKLTVALNANMNRNELTKMPKMSNGDTKVINGNGLFSQVKGHSVTEFYTREWAGVNSQTGEAQWYGYYNPNDNNADGSHKYITSYVQYVSEQGDGFSEDVIEKEKVTDYDDATSTFIGKDARPDFEGGFNLRAEYKRFTLSTQFSFGIGGYAYDYTYAELMDDGGLGTVNFHKDMLNSWKKPGDITNVPALRSGYNGNASNANRTSTRFLTSNSYLWLNNVRLSYDFSPELLKSVNLSGASVYVTGDNLAVWSSRKGMVPTMSYSGDSDSNYAYAPVSTMTIGLKINF